MGGNGTLSDDCGGCGNMTGRGKYAVECAVGRREAEPCEIVTQVLP